MHRCPRLLSLLGLALAAPAHAEYSQHQLQVRTSINDAYGVPVGSSINSVSPRISDSGQVAVKLLLNLGGSFEYGLVTASDGVVLGTWAAPTKSIPSDVDINESGQVVIEVKLSSGQDGLWIYETSSGNASRVSTSPLGASSWGSPRIDNLGRLGYRASFSGAGNAFASWPGSGAAAIHAAEVGVDPLSPYAFLFTPDTDELRRIVAKVRLGGPGEFGEDRPDQIRRFDDTGASELIAEDRDSDPGSQFLRFDNSLGTSDSGVIAFVAGLDGGQRGVFRWDDGVLAPIAITGAGQISEIQSFPPDVNDAGQVVFRARNASTGLRAIFVGDGNTLVPVMSEHDTVLTDLGLARIDQNNAGDEVFGGAPAINNSGQVTYTATLTPENDDQIEWGTGVFVSSADDRIFADDFE